MSSSSAPSITELANGVAGLVVMSGLFAGVSRSLAILRGLSTAAVDRMTAIGFLVGTVFAMVILGFDAGGR
jgi:hypothetical protein